MRLPRDLSGKELAKTLQILGYTPDRQTGSHLRLSTLQKGEHHITIPLHNSLRVGTLAQILTDVGKHFDLDRDELINRLFGK